MADQVTYDAFREYGLILRYAKNTLLDTKDGRKFVDKVATPLATDLLENYLYSIFPNEGGTTCYGNQRIVDLFSGSLERNESDEVQKLLQSYDNSVVGVRDCLRNRFSTISPYLTRDQRSACEKLLG